MNRCDMELANEVNIIPADAKSPPQNVTARCEVILHSRQDSDPEITKRNSIVILFVEYIASGTKKKIRFRGARLPESKRPREKSTLLR